MKHRSLIAVLAGFAIALAAAISQLHGGNVLASGLTSVSGHIVTFGPKPEPVRHARVLLQSTSSAEAVASTTTNDQGLFEFVDVAPGRYRLRAGKAGWLEGTFGAVRPGQPGSSVLLGANQQLHDLIVRLARGSAIAGTVTNDSGEPVANIEVRVLRTVLSLDSGQPSLQPYGEPRPTRTDNEGRYRVYGLPAGDFVVAAVPVPDSNAQVTTAPRLLHSEELDAIVRGLGAAATRPSGVPPSSNLSPRVAYSPVFHPAATGASEATVVHLESEEERTGINIMVRLTPSTEIVGSVSSSLPIAIGSLQVVLGSLRDDALTLGATLAQVNPSGRFVLSQIGPGIYYVLATARELRAGASSPANLYALARTEASGTRVSLDLSLQPGMEVAGQVKVDGAVPAPPDLQSMRLRLLPQKETPAVPIRAINADVLGFFRFDGIPPGAYRLSVALSPTAGLFVDSANLGGRNVLDVDFTVDHGVRADAIALDLTRHPTILTGTLQMQSGAVTPEFFLVAFSTERELWRRPTRRVAIGRSDSTGQFTIRGLPPGKYYLAVTTDLDESDVDKPDIFERLVPDAVTVTLESGKTTRQDLRVGR